MKTNLCKRNFTVLMPLLITVVFILFNSLTVFSLNQSVVSNTDLAYEWSGPTNSLENSIPVIENKLSDQKQSSIFETPKIPWSAPAATACTVTPSTTSVCYGTAFTVTYVTSGVSTSGYIGTASYNIDGGAWAALAINTTTTLSYTPLPGTHTYGIRVLGSLGQAVTGGGPSYTTVTVTAPATAGAISISSTSICPGNSVTLSSTTNATATCGSALYIRWYRWNGTAWTDLGQTNQQTLTDTPPSSGSYSYLRRAWSSLGVECSPACYDATSATVNVLLAPPAVNVSGSGTFCNNATLTATPSQQICTGNYDFGTGTTSYTDIPLYAYYNYSRSTSLILRSEIPSCTPNTISTLAINVATAGSHNFTNMEIRLMKTTATTLGTAWDGTGTLVWSGSYTFNATGWVTFDIADFNWNSDNLMITWQYSGAYTSNYPYFNTTSTGTYLQNTNYSDASLPTTMIQVYPRVNYRLAMTSPSSTIYWENTTSNGTSTAAPSTTQTVASTGTYYFRPQSSAGCWGPQGSATVVINSPPLQPGVISGVVNQCPGQIGQIYSISAVSGATSYNWAVPAGWTITNNSGTTITVTTGTAGSSGNISVTASGSCGTSAPRTLAVNVSAPAAVTVSGGGVFCGGSAKLIASGGAGGAIYFKGTTSGGTKNSSPFIF